MSLSTKNTIRSNWNALRTKLSLDYKNDKPQMNADERRLIAIIHRKGREERKAEGQKSLRLLQLIEYHGFPTARGNNENVIFQTGLTGSTGCVISFNQVHPVIMEANS
jgi:hypothetical protein